MSPENAHKPAQARLAYVSCAPCVPSAPCLQPPTCHNRTAEMDSERDYVLTNYLGKN